MLGVVTRVLMGTPTLQVSIGTGPVETTPGVAPGSPVPAVGSTDAGVLSLGRASWDVVVAEGGGEANNNNLRN